MIHHPSRHPRPASRGETTLLQLVGPWCVVLWVCGCAGQLGGGGDDGSTAGDAVVSGDATGCCDAVSDLTQQQLDATVPQVDGPQGVDAATPPVDGPLPPVDAKPPKPDTTFTCPPPSTPAPGKVVFSREQWIVHGFQVLLNRTPKGGEMDSRVAAMQGGQTPGTMFANLLKSSEFTKSSTLKDRAGYVKRLYKVLLERTAKADEVTLFLCNLKTAAGSGSGYTWWEAFRVVASSKEYRSKRRPMAGVHFAIPTDPTVSVSDADFVEHLYRLLLNRGPDAGGLASHLRTAIAGGWAADFKAFVGSLEFQQNSALHDPTGYVQRLYKVLLKRSGTASEVANWAATLGQPDSSGNAPGWLAAYQGFIGSAEFKTVNCHTSYFTYGEAIKRGSALLDDVMTGKARIQTVQQTKPIVDQPSQDGSKLAFFKWGSAYYAFSRYLVSDSSAPGGHRLNIRLYQRTATSPPTLKQVSGDWFKPSEYASFAYNMYDPQLLIDHTVCPKRYLLSMECDGSLCTSFSTKPTRAETWPPPRQLVTGSQKPYHSASTGMTLLDHEKPYLSWTDVQNGNDFNAVEGTERAVTVGIGLKAVPYSQAPLSAPSYQSSLILTADKNTKCTSAWDCNNRDGQDWKKEGPYFYVLYNGANYFGCDGPSYNHWGLSVARSAKATGLYPTFAPKPVMGDQKGTCDLSYPMVHAESGALIVTYANQEYSGSTYLRPATRWSPLVWN